MSPERRVRRTFWMLVVITVGAVGVVGRALGWPASPVAGATVAAASAVAATTGALALRILVVLDRQR